MTKRKPLAAQTLDDALRAGRVVSIPRLGAEIRPDRRGEEPENCVDCEWFDTRGESCMLGGSPEMTPCTGELGWSERSRGGFGWSSADCPVLDIERALERVAKGGSPRAATRTLFRALTKAISAAARRTEVE